MTKFLKFTALLVAVMAIVWGATIWRWQATNRLISTNDIVVYLFVLPVLAFAGIALVVWLAARRRDATASAPTPAATATADARASATPEHGHALIVDSSVALAIGSDASAALATLAEGKTQPELDDAFRDEQGFPLLAGRVKGLDLSETQDQLEHLQPLLVAKRPEWEVLTPSPGMVRALALLVSPLSAAVESCSRHWESHAAAGGKASDAKPSAPAPGLALVWALPAAWSEHEQALARRWIAQLLKQSPLPQDGWQFVVEPMDSAEAHLLKADQQLARWQQEQRPGLLIALACDSLLDEQRIGVLARQQLLHTASKPKGCIPGEGAAAALLATPDWPQLDLTDPSLTRLHRAAVTRRDKSADAGGRTDASMLTRACTDALACARLPAAGYGALVSDVDLRASRSTELTDAAMDALPGTDPVDASYRLGLACGDIGLARGLCCVALASAQVQAERKPVLVAMVMHPHDRLAVAVAPLPEPALTA